MNMKSFISMAACMLVVSILIINTASADTVDFTDNGSFGTASLTEGNVTVAGFNANCSPLVLSGCLVVVNGFGLSIAGGQSSIILDPFDGIMRFSFTNPVSNVLITLSANDPGDGTSTINFESFDSGNASLGQVGGPFSGTGPFATGGFSNVSRLDVTVTEGGIRIAAISFTTLSPVPELSCSGFMPPFDQPLSLKKKVKRTIPVKIIFTDADGYTVTDADIAAPPVINVLFDSQVFGEVPPDTDDLLPRGSANEDNVFRFDPDSGQWIYNLGTKQFSTAGTYTVTVTSGDSDEYTISFPGGSCTQTFERLP